MSSKRNQTSTSPVGSPLSSDNCSKEQDRFLPIANVSRIMKKSLPANAKISKEAKETVQECVSEFISFITGEASDKCQREKRKTINGDDLLWAMTTLGFENYVGPLKGYLNKYREVEGEKNSMARQEDQSPTHNTSTTTPPHPSSNHGVHHEIMINKAAATSVPNKVNLQDFNNGGGFYSLGGVQMNPKCYEDISGMVIGYGDNHLSGSYNVNGGDGNTNRAMAAHLHHGVGW